jgi:hypothetical protein
VGHPHHTDNNIFFPFFGLPRGLFVFHWQFVSQSTDVPMWCRLNSSIEQKQKEKNKRLMMKTQKWTRLHDWIETSTIREYHPWQNKWYPDIYELTPDDEDTPKGDVILFLKVTAKSLSSCSLKLPSQWSVPIKPVQMSVGNWSLELARGGFPLVYIRHNCRSRNAFVTLKGEDIAEITCKENYYFSICAFWSTRLVLKGRINLVLSFFF